MKIIMRCFKRNDLVFTNITKEVDALLITTALMVKRIRRH